MEQKQKRSRQLLISSKSFLFLILLFISVTGMYSCKNNGSSCLKSLSDSIKVAKAVLATRLDSLLRPKDVEYEQMVNLVLTADNVEYLFTNPEVAQIRFDWTSLGGLNWGLTAYGIDNNGVTVAGVNPVRLATVGGGSMSNVFRLTHSRIYLSRGQVKGLLGLPRGTNDPINGGYADIYFSPNQDLKPPAGVSIFLYYQCDNFNGGYTDKANPSPPANPPSPCLANCDL